MSNIGSPRIIFPKLDPKTALTNVAQGVAVEGFPGVSVDKSLGAVSALQEGSGASVAPKLRVVFRKSGKGSRIDVVFIIHPEWVAPKAPRAAECAGLLLR